MCVLVACGSSSAPPTKNVSAPSPATIDQLCKAFEVCSGLAGVCDTQIGLDIWREKAEWSLKLFLGKEGQTGKQVRVDLAARTCDGKPVQFPEVAGGVPIDEVIALGKTCAKGARDLDQAIVLRFAVGTDGNDPSKFENAYSVQWDDAKGSPFTVDVDLKSRTCKPGR